MTNGIYLSENDTRSNVCYLYNDGTIFMARNGFELKTLCLDNLSRNVPWSWGFFDVAGRDMYLQRVNSVSIQTNSKYQIDNYSGYVINDTTFVIKQVIYYDGETKMINDTFKFNNCTAKPDSMNVILKNIRR